MDRASIKELYDNRDLISQMINIKNQVDNLPTPQELCKFKHQISVFLDVLPYVMLEDKKANVVEEHTYEVIPKYKEFKAVGDLDDLNFICKKHLAGLGDAFLKLHSEQLQYVDGPVHFKSGITRDKIYAWDDLNQIDVVNKGELDIYLKKYLDTVSDTVQKVLGPVNFENKVEAEDIDARSVKSEVININRPESERLNEKEVFSVGGDSLFDGNIYSFGDIQTNMIDAQYGQFKERPSLKEGAEQPVVGTNFITMDDLSNPELTNVVYRYTDNKPQELNTTLNFISSLGIAFGNNKSSIYDNPVQFNYDNSAFYIVANEQRNDSTAPLYRSSITMTTALDQRPKMILKTHSCEGVGFGSDITIHSGAIELQTLAETLEPINYLLFDKDGLFYSKFNYAGGSRKVQSQIRTIDDKVQIASYNSGEPRSYIDVSDNNISVGHYNKNILLETGLIRFINSNCKTYISSDEFKTESKNTTETTYFSLKPSCFSVKSGKYMLDFDKTGFRITTDPGFEADMFIMSPNQHMIRLGVPDYGYTDIVDTKTKHMYLNDSDAHLAISMELTKGSNPTQIHLQARSNVSASMYTHVWITPDMIRFTRNPVISLNENDPGSYLATEEYVKNNTIQTIKSTGAENGLKYEQIEMPFMLFNRPISMIIRRTQEDGVYKDQLMIKSMDTIKTISEQYIQ